MATTLHLQNKQIYLCKSKVGNFDLIVKVKALLARYQLSFTEFIGGNYTSEKLDNAEVIIVCPILETDIAKKPVGKGQYDEISSSIRNGKTVLLYSNGYFYKIFQTSKNADALLNWQNNYGQVTVNLSEKYTLEPEIYQNLNLLLLKKCK